MEVKSMKEGQQGLFATKRYQPGDVILEEAPLFTFAPPPTTASSNCKSNSSNSSSNSSNSSDSSSQGSWKQSIRSQFQNDCFAQKKKSNKEKSAKQSAMTTVGVLGFVSSSIPSSIHENHHAKFIGMITAVIVYAMATSTASSPTSTIATADTDKLLSLYHPSVHDSDNNDDNSTTKQMKKKEHEHEHEQAIVQLAQQAYIYLHSKTLPSTPVHSFIHNPTTTEKQEHPVHPQKQLCLKLMLIWTCNSFQGGHVYHTMSRINHSCDFNAVITLPPQPLPSHDSSNKNNNRSNKNSNKNKNNNNAQIVKAASTIEPGDEIHISYLGSCTYVGYDMRQSLLAQDKYFDCRCTRCLHDCKIGDAASSIPSILHHERSAGCGRYLDEDVQYDDGDGDGDSGVTVHYAMPKQILNVDNDNVGGHHGKQQQNEQDEEEIRYVPTTTQCDGLKTQKGETSFALPATLHTTMEKTIRTIMTHLKQCENNDDNDNNDEELVEMTERLICLSYSVLGSKHYCTNLLLVKSLGYKLSSMHASMLFSSSSSSSSSSNIKIDSSKTTSSKTSSAPALAIDISDIAECIDLLERCYTFINGLKLKSHAGHLLGNVTVGVARVLVGLGDVKSMKFGSEWVQRVQDYFESGLEGDGMAEVVLTLLNAWQRLGNDDGNDGNHDDDIQKCKRIKL
jgi:hypothetical protein